MHVSTSTAYGRQSLNRSGNSVSETGDICARFLQQGSAGAPLLDQQGTEQGYRLD